MHTQRFKAVLYVCESSHSGFSARILLGIRTCRGRQAQGKLNLSPQVIPSQPAASELGKEPFSPLGSQKNKLLQIRLYILISSNFNLKEVRWLYTDSSCKEPVSPPVTQNTFLQMKALPLPTHMALDEVEKLFALSFTFFSLAVGFDNS